MHDAPWLSFVSFAYIDPGGGEFLFQILLGGIFAWAFRFRRAVIGLFRDRETTRQPKPTKL